jgi:hypothetical protein
MVRKKIDAAKTRKITRTEKGKKRGVWLNIWLSIMLVANFITAFSYLVFTDRVAATFPHVAVGVWYFFGLVAFANFIFVIFLFNWKKWPFYGFCMTSIVAAVMNLMIGLQFVAATFGLLGILILYLSMKPKWKLFE